MPLPGDGRPARHRVRLVDPIWDSVYTRIGTAVTVISTRMNRLQFLTIRRYLGLVLWSLILLLVVTLWR